MTDRLARDTAQRALLRAHARARPLEGMDVQERLTDRQRFALEHIAAHQPIPSVELGAVLHQERALRRGNGHSATETCEWCATEGRGMGKALRAKGLVRERRGAGWVLEGARLEAGLSGDPRRYDPATAPFPAGF